MQNAYSYGRAAFTCLLQCIAEMHPHALRARTAWHHSGNVQNGHRSDADCSNTPKSIEDMEEDPDHKSWSLEDALAEVGTGRFQWTMLLVCGLANAADAVEILSVGLLGPAAEHDLHLTTKSQGALNASIFVGMFLGGAGWGYLSDTMGRRPALLLALLMNAAFGLMSAASTTLTHLAVLRLLAGVGVGGSMPVVFSQMSELCEAKSRGQFMALLAGCWMFGSIYSALTGWIIIPWMGWRLFAVLASLPAWLCCLLIWMCMPESPRWLAARGQVHLAVQVLHSVAAANGRKLPHDFTVHAAGWSDACRRADDLDLPDEDESSHLLLPHKYNGSAPSAEATGQLRKTASHRPHVLARIRQQLSGPVGVLTTLVTPPLLSYTGPLAVAWVGLCGGWYCTVLWLPKYFQARGATHSSMYAETLAVALANLPGNIVTLLLVDRLGRRRTACFCMAAACVCALLFAAAPAHGVWPTLAACVFNGVSVGGWTSLDMISAELYPTNVRSSGFGVLNATGRISAFLATFVAGALMEWRLWAPLVMTAVLLAVGSAALLLLPEPAGQPLDDIMPRKARSSVQTAQLVDIERAIKQPSNACS